MSTEFDKLCKAKEIAEITGWSLAKVYAMMAARELPCVRSGRSVRVPIGAFRRWVELNTTGTEAA